MPAPLKLDGLRILDVGFDRGSSHQSLHLVCLFAFFVVFTQLAQAGQNGDFEYANGHWVGKSGGRPHTSLKAA